MSGLPAVVSFPFDPDGWPAETEAEVLGCIDVQLSDAGDVTAIGLTAGPGLAEATMAELIHFCAVEVHPRVKRLQSAGVHDSSWSRVSTGCWQLTLVERHLPK